MTQPTTLTPKLRFPEFRDEQAWQEKPLGLLGRFTRGLTYSADDVTSQGLPVLRSTNIQEGSLILDRDLVFVGKECPDALRMQKGDIAICMSNGSKALVGKSAEYAGDYPGDITVGAFCSFFRPNLPFAKLAFQTNDYARYVGVLIAGGNINNLNNSVLEEFDFPIPPSEAEQQKIAECLSTLDELIGAESQKLDALKAHKKGLMQQLFPRKGETLPRLRFPEFHSAPEWAKKKIGRVVTPTVRERDKPSTAYTGLGLRSHGKGTFLKHAENPDKNSMDVLFEVKRDDLILSITFAWEGAVAIAKDCDDGALVSHRFPTFTINPEESIPEFLRYVILDKQFVYSLGVISPGGAGRNRVLNKNDFLGLSFLLPGIEEQKRIATCLSSLDELIAAQSDRHSALQTHKQGLLQQLFPSPVEADV